MRPRLAARCGHQVSIVDRQKRAGALRGLPGGGVERQHAREVGGVEDLPDDGLHAREP
jgi:hypothetical protein